MLLKKGELHHLVNYVEPASIPGEVSEKLSCLREIFETSIPHDEMKGA